MGRFKSDKFRAFKHRTILDAAFKVFSEKGPDKATMREIAAEAGVTTGAVYSMFDGKDALYAELLEESLDRLHGFVERRHAEASTPEAALRAAVTAFYEYYAPRVFEVSLGMHSFGGLKPGSLGEDWDKRLNRNLNATLDIMAQAVLAYRPRTPPERVAALRASIFSSLLGTLVLLHTGRARSIGSDAEEILRVHVDGLIDGLGI